MDHNPKARGQRHLQNKKKYGKKPTNANIQPSVIKRNAPQQLDSNWDRYEQKPEAFQLDSSTDFSVLAKAPISHGSHFQFKSDKKISQEATAPLPDLFNLDLQLLSKSILSQPLYVQNNIPVEYFTDSQRELMERTALENAEKYKNYLLSRGLSKTESVFDSTEANLTVSPAVSPSEDSVKNESDDVTILLETLQLSEEESTRAGTPEPPLPPSVKAPTVEKCANSDDLEDWLDDLLDD